MKSIIKQAFLLLIAIPAELINFTGQNIIVMNAGMKREFSIPVSAIPSGIYIIKLKNGTGTSLKKIMV